MPRFGTISLLVLILLSPAQAVAEDKLADHFVDPPASAQAWTYWWWLNGYATKDGIRRDLDAMQQLGISGALVFHAGQGPTPKQVEFMSPAWRQLFQYAVQEAAARGIEIGLNICAGWNAGGPWVEPNDAAKMLVHRTIRVSGPTAFDEVLARPAGADATYQDVAVLAWPTDESGVEVKLTASSPFAQHGFRDLTERMDAGGRLRWQVPNGNWLVLRLGWKVHPRAHTKCTGGASHLEIDPLSADAMDKHFAHTVGANFDRHVTWWPMGRAWLTYLARCQHLLQSGGFHADVCYFQGEWVPSYVPARWAMDPPLPPGCRPRNATRGPMSRLIGKTHRCWNPACWGR